MHGHARADDPRPLGRFVTRANARAALTYGVIALLLVLAVLTLGRQLDHHLGALESWIESVGPWGPLAFVALFVVATSLLVPDSVLCVVAGALFGMAWGTAAVVAGALLASTLQFALSRRLLRARIERTLARRPSLAAIQRAVLRDELRLQLLVRLTPVNPATVSYLLGAAGVRFAPFLTACLALVPTLIIEVYFGHAGSHVARAAVGASRTGALHDAALLGGLVVCMLVLAVVSRLTRRALLEAVSGPATGAP